MEVDNHEGFRTFTRESELNAVGPARIWILADEHEATIDDGYFLVSMDDRTPFASFPGDRHGRAYGLNFADAHVATIRLREAGSQATSRIDPRNTDWLRLKQITTVK